jgi:hypothetical protein
LDSLKDQLLNALGRGEPHEELLRDYREVFRFGEYLKFLREGEKAWYWKNLHEQAKNGNLPEEDIDAIFKGGSLNV